MGPHTTLATTTVIMSSGARRRLVVTVAVAALALSTVGAVFGPTPTAAAAPADSVRSVKPARLLDTRPGQPTIDGKFAGVGRRKAGSTIEVQVAGRADVAKTATAAMLNLTAVFPSEGTVLTAFPCGIKRPEASNLNVPVGDIRANSAFVKLSPTGTVCVYTASATDVIIDVNGYVPAGGSPISQNPARLLETRRDLPTVDGAFAGIGRRRAGSVTKVQVSGRAGVPDDADAALLNVTSIFPSDGTVLTIYSCDLFGRPEASNLNVPADDIRANNAFVKLSGDGKICIYTAEATDIVVDINGYVPSGQRVASVYPQRMMDTRPEHNTYDGVGAGIGRLPESAIVELPIAGRGAAPKSARAAMLNITAVSPNPGTVVTVFPCGSVPDASSLNVPADDIRANNVFVRLSAAGSVCLYTASATDLVVDLSGYVVEPATTSMCVSSITRLAKKECEALVAIYNATNGTTWGRSNEWATNTDPCRWQGVVCELSYPYSHVTNLNLNDPNVTGALPAAIGDLTYLTKLGFNGASLTSVPPEIGRLTNLFEFDLVKTKVSALPSSIGNLHNLSILNVTENELTSLPDSIGNLSRLTVLRARGNELSRLPNSISKLSRLSTLDASNNKMAFDVTSVFAPFNSPLGLRQLMLSGNGCLTTTSSSLATWLSSRDPRWNDGC